MKIIRKTIVVLGAAAAIAAGALVSTPVASADCASGGAGGFGGGGFCDTFLPNGDKWHCETVYVLGFGGTNCFVIPKGDPRNP